MTKTTYRTGLIAEKLCRLALRLKLYRILGERYKTPFGEIDIIAARGRTVVAVEVKSRTTRDAAIESISPQQQLRISNALEYFIMRTPRFANANLRFDVMLASPWRWPTHIKNAWFAN